MREILFKAKRKDNGKWVKGFYYETYWKNYILFGMADGVPNMIEVFPETLCQYTGMTDKNGDKIWENDIVEADGIKGIIKFGKYKHHNSIQVGWFVDFINKEQLKYVRQDYIFWIEQGITIIGNVFDNPELLEEEK